MNYSSTMTLGKFLSGISKTLGVANQVIPLYQQTKPLIRNVRTAYSLIKTNNKEDVRRTKSTKNVTTVTNSKPKEKTSTYTNNSPQFFI